ncbi:hypothetical protein J3R83DRAFT_11920 [Lanmaoa asiatica]|nr:hypothetical protein J3R83DRAFT_11920 [Lanmaoa asiatica]
MPPTDKAKAAGISVTSFFDLKAELAKKSDEFVRTKAAADGLKNRPVWARSNEGVHGRAARDVELEAVSKVTVESARAALERKAKVYEKLMKGKSGGLSEKQYEALLVDFDSKGVDHYDSDSDDVDESLTVPTKPNEDEDDPIIEYEDEFGRLRTSRRSEVPRHLLKSQDEEEDVDEAYVVWVYFRELDLTWTILSTSSLYTNLLLNVSRLCKTELAEADNPLSSHYDASKEVRAKGAAFYQFSGDEDTRKQQMEELRAAREETKKTRDDLGAMDTRPGEVEGMRAESGQTTSRALEKRKREIEQRRALLEAKRRKTKVVPEGDGVTGQASSSVTPPVTSVANDPFAALEKRADMSTSRTPEVSETRSTKGGYSEADAFLAQLEQDMLKKR